MVIPSQINMGQLLAILWKSSVYKYEYCRLGGGGGMRDIWETLERCWNAVATLL